MASPKRVSRFAAGVLALMAMVIATQAQAQGLNLIRDTEIEETIKKEATPVIAASGLKVEDVHFYLVGDKELNAFSAAGQNIFLNTGLIQETESPNQLVGVIAHEAGHISGGHMVRGDVQRAGMKPFLLTMGLGVLAALAGAPDAAGALIVSAGQMGALGAMTYSRVQEASADQAAANALEKAGISGKGLLEFFENYRYQEVFDDSRKFEYFRSHPLSEDRIEALRRKVEAEPHYVYVDPPELVALHQIMKAKLRAFMDPPQQTFIKYKETDTSFIARYARAIAYYKSTEPEKALAQLDGLLADFPNNPYLWELKGQVLLESSHAAEAEVAHRKAVSLKPDAPLLHINLAQALISQEQGQNQTVLSLKDNARLDEAISELNRSLAVEKDNAVAFRMLSEAYDAKHMPGQARLARAEYHFAQGELRDAKAFAIRARGQLPKDSPEWRRATDIVLVSAPTQDDLRQLARSERGGSDN
jgi:predicted Zn-dependent protease